MHKSIAFAFALAAAPATALAGPQHILIGLDQTSTFATGGTVYSAPGKDSLLVLDTTNPAKPTFGTPLPMSNSVFGPPTNLQITPDGALGLVASSVIPVQQYGRWVQGSDNQVHVVDLATMKQIGSVKVGDQPQGVAISKDGKLALVATRAGRGVSVLTIDGQSVTEVARVDVGDAAVGVAITPDGKRAFVMKSTTMKLGVLKIDGQRVTYDPAFDLPTGYNPYNIALTPDGTMGFVVNNGIRGNAGSITVFDPRGDHPRVVDTLAVGDGPEGFAMAPDGKSAIVLLLHGSTSGTDEWPYHPNGGAVMIAIKDGKARVLPREVKLGGVPEGVAYSRDSAYAYAGDYNEQVLHILRVSPSGLKETGTMALPGHPASMRGPAQ